jgi:hypothetical protein
MVLQRRHAVNGYGFGLSGQEPTVSEDDDDRSELEAEARVLPEHELMALISTDSSAEPPAEERGDQTPLDDSEDASS